MVKVIKIKHVGFFGLSYLLVLLLPLISTIIGARYQVMINERESKSVTEVKQIRENAMILTLSLEKSLMPMNNYLITGEITDNEQSIVEENLNNSLLSLKESISKLPDNETKNNLIELSDSIEASILYVLEYEYKILSSNLRYTRETNNAMKIMDEHLSRYSNHYEQFDETLDLLITEVVNRKNASVGRSILIVLLINVLLIAFIIFVLIKTFVYIKKFISQFVVFMEKITKEKKFNQKMKKFKIKEIDIIIDLVNDFVEEIKMILSEFNLSSIDLATFSEQLAASSQEVSSATQEVSASTENITSDVMLLKDYTDNMNKTVEQINAVMDNTVKFLDKAKNVNEDFMGLMKNETAMIKNSSDNFEGMQLSVENIKVFIDEFIGQVKNIQESVISIKKVHKKIELLSLNAAIEAARAGKEGGGFAVIAEEIRSLSSRSSDASKDIETIMDGVIDNIRKLHGLINESLEGFKSIREDWDKVSDISVKVSTESEKTYNETNNLTNSIGQIESQFTELKKIFKEIKLRIDNVVASSEQISSSNEEITSQMEELTSSSQELAEKAQGIKGFVDSFKV